MYVCTECGCVFEDGKKYYGEWLEHFGTPCREETMGCPSCGENYCEAYRCELCGEYITEDYYKDDDGNRYCESHFTLMNLGDE